MDPATSRVHVSLRGTDAPLGLGDTQTGSCTLSAHASRQRGQGCPCQSVAKAPWGPLPHA